MSNDINENSITFGEWIVVQMRPVKSCMSAVAKVVTDMYNGDKMKLAENAAIVINISQGVLIPLVIILSLSLSNFKCQDCGSGLLTTSYSIALAIFFVYVIVAYCAFAAYDKLKYSKVKACHLCMILIANFTAIYGLHNWQFSSILCALLIHIFCIMFMGIETKFLCDQFAYRHLPLHTDETVSLEQQQQDMVN